MNLKKMKEAFEKAHLKACVKNVMLHMDEAADYRMDDGFDTSLLKEVEEWAINLHAKTEYVDAMLNTIKEEIRNLRRMGIE